MSSARGFIDDAPLDFPCPECGRTVKTTVGKGRRNEAIRCSGGHTIKVDGSDLDRGTRRAEASIDKIMRRLG